MKNILAISFGLFASIASAQTVQSQYGYPNGGTIGSTVILCPSTASPPLVAQAIPCVFGGSSGGGSSGTVTQGSAGTIGQSWFTENTDGTNVIGTSAHPFYDSIVNFPATQSVNAVSLPLPANAAQETGGNLATVATAQGTSGSSITQPTGGAGILGWLSGIYKAITGTLTISGTVTATQATGTNLHVVVDSAPSPNSQAVTNAGTFAVQNTAAIPTGSNTIGTVNVNGTVPISAASLPLPTGAATAANQTNVESASGTSPTTLIGVQGSATGVPIPVSFTPSGTQNNNLIQIGGTSVLTGAGATGTGSQRTTVAVDSSTIAGSAPSTVLTVTQSSQPLPTGAATAANQSTQITAEQSTATNTTNLAKGPTTNATISFRQTCSTTATALASNTFTNGFIVTALSTNTGSDNVGGSTVTTANGYLLIPGQSISYNEANSNQTYLICSNSTDVVAVTGN